VALEEEIGLCLTLDSVSSVGGPCVGDPPSENDTRLLDVLERAIVVVPAKGFDLGEHIDIGKVVEEFLDVVVVELGIEGIAWETVLQIVEDPSLVGAERLGR
jgi:hypothetical protein